MSFSILRLLAVSIELSYRLSMALNPNPKPIFLAEVSLVENRPIRNELSYVTAFDRFDGTLMQVIEDQDSESEIRCCIRTSH